MEKVAILGAGNGGFAFSGHLALKGYEVRLYEDPKFGKSIEKIKDKGGIEVSGTINGFGKVALASTDIVSVLAGVKVVMITVPAFAQMIMFEAALPYLEDGQIIVFWPGNFAEILAKKMMKEKSVSKDIKLAGTGSLLYAARKIGPNKVGIFYEKAIMHIACLPALDTSNVVKALKEFFPQISPAKNVLEIGLTNLNMIVHCGTAILNAGWIEHTKGDFEFYRHGITESVCRVLEKADEEKVAVGKALGLKVKSTLDIFNEWYPTEKKETLHEFVTHSRVHCGHGSDAPKHLRERYITEDVPAGLVATSSLGKISNVPTPTIDSLIWLASILNREDYRKTGRNLDCLGFSGMSKEEIINYINTGK